MQHLEPVEFGRRTAAGRPCGHYDFSLYYGLRFQCACGVVHDLRPWMEIVCELPLLRFVVVCPAGLHLTVLKARWNRQQQKRTLEAELGTELPERHAMRNGLEFQARWLEARTGRRWSLEETAELMEHQHGLARLRRR